MKELANHISKGKIFQVEICHVEKWSGGQCSWRTMSKEELGKVMGWMWVTGTMHSSYKAMLRVLVFSLREMKTHFSRVLSRGMT